MKLNDVRMLWARSGNRCAFPQCRIEMAPDGSQVTLGEMAHIVAKSAEGPRGDFPLPLEARDDFDNLILLCPTHHNFVDNNPLDWPVDRLKLLKHEHEAWVAAQLEAGSISIHTLGGIDFISNRIKQVIADSHTKTWVYFALSPLSAENDTIQPKSKSVIDIIAKTYLPQTHCVNPQPNRHHTRPNQFGVQNEDLRELPQGRGHSLQVYRNGHTEIAICIDDISMYITSLYRDNPKVQADTRKLIHYTNVSECAEAGILFLKQLWDRVLPFPNMIFSYLLTDTQNSKLTVDSRRYESKWFSYLVKTPALEANRVFERQDPKDQLLHFALEGIVESYGWVLPKLRDEDGEFSLPSSLIQ
jgi:hypothetical protein